MLKDIWDFLCISIFFNTQFLREQLTAFCRTLAGKHCCSVYLFEICILLVAVKAWILVVYGISFISDIANSSDNTALSVRMINK